MEGQRETRTEDKLGTPLMGTRVGTRTMTEGKQRWSAGKGTKRKGGATDDDNLCSGFMLTFTEEGQSGW